MGSSDIVNMTSHQEAALLAAAVQLDIAGRTKSALRVLDTQLVKSWKRDQLQSFLAAPRGVSVIVISDADAAALARTLQSLRTQDLDLSLLEIIVVTSVHSNEQQEGETYVCSYSSDPLHMFMRGQKQASRRFATLIHAGDQISPSYLDVLLQAASPNAVVLAPVQNNSECAQTAPLNNLILEGCQICTPELLPPHVYMSAAKLFPTVLFDDVPVIPKGTLGCDLMLWAIALTDGELALHLPHSAVFYIRQNQLDQPAPCVLEESIGALATFVAICAGHKGPFITDVIAMLLDPVIAAIQSGIFSWETVVTVCQAEDMAFDVTQYLAEQVAKTLVISYCFAPYTDTSGVVMVKRIRSFDTPVDVVSNALDDLYTKDSSLALLTQDYVGHHKILQGKQAYADPTAVIDFAENVENHFVKSSKKSNYKTIYSRAMWPASHFAAALVKLRNPDIKWIAEFSDPLAINIDGKPRRKRMPREWLKKVGLWRIVKSQLPKSKPQDYLFFWAEALAYAIADELVFTNQNQQDHMLSQSWIIRHRDTLLNRARVTAHPTLSAEFYQMGQEAPSDRSKITIGYFGRFYQARGLEDILAALVALDPIIRARLLLYVYSPDPLVLLSKVSEYDLVDTVLHRPLLPYLDFLSSLSTFDYLLVNDATTLGVATQNPYLPSKLSDYLGAGRPILALAEPGSILSRHPLPSGSLRCTLGDAKAYQAALEQLHSSRHV